MLETEKKTIIVAHGKPIIVEDRTLFKITHILNDSFFLTEADREKQKTKKPSVLEKKIEIKEIEDIEENVIPRLDLTNPEWLEKQVKKIQKIQHRYDDEFNFKSNIIKESFCGSFKGQKFEWEELWLKKDHEKMFCSEMWNRYIRLRSVQIGHLLKDDPMSECNILQIQRELENIPYDISYDLYKHESELYNEFDYIPSSDEEENDGSDY